jgi:hypothetical protein
VLPFRTAAGLLLGLAACGGGGGNGAAFGAGDAFGLDPEGGADASANRVVSMPVVGVDATSAPPPSSGLHVGTAPAGLRVAGDASPTSCVDDGGALDAGDDGGAVGTLTWGQSTADSIVVDSVNVYWTADGEVLGMPLSGGAPVVLATGQWLPHGLAVDGTSVYWTCTDGSVMKAPIAGGAWTLLATGPSYTIPIVGMRNLAVDATHVYWTNPGSGGAVLEVPIAGGDAIVLASGQASAGPIAVDATNVYYGTAASLMTVPIGGGTPVAIASGPDVAFPAAIALDSANVYWTNQDANDLSTGTLGSAVMKASLSGGDPQTLASEEGIPGDLAVDTTGAYWLQSFVNDDRVMYVAFDGGAPVTRSSTAPGNLNEVGIALGCSRVYWTASTLGTIDPGNTANDIASVGGVLWIAR